MNHWTQNYDPAGSPIWSPILAAVPIVLLLVLLASGRVRAHQAALMGLLSAVLMGIFVFQPNEVGKSHNGLLDWAVTVLTATATGAVFGLFPIGWIVLTAIFLYNLTVASGQHEIVKQSVMSLSGDRRIQAILIAFCFGAFLEGAAGFGTPVAISAALLMGAGFRPVNAAGYALLANTAPVAFGALGTPIVTLAKVTGLNELQLSAMAGRQLPFFSLLVPAWLVWTMGGWRAALGVWPALLVGGGSFALVQFLVSNYHGPWLVDIVGGVISLLSLAIFLRLWQPTEVWHFPDERPDAQKGVRPPLAASHPAAGPDPFLGNHTKKEIFTAWLPWVLLSVFVFLWGLPQSKKVLGQVTLHYEVPGLHLQVSRDRPVVAAREPEAAVFDFNWLSATGTSIFLAAVASSWWLGINVRRFFLVFTSTCRSLLWPLFTIACMLAIAFTTRYTGMDGTLGLAFTKTGWLYPMFAALLGWLGVALTGSDTSSNALFGSLQTVTARHLVVGGVLPLSEPQAMLLLATANSTGGVMGKMIDAQSIVISTAATGQTGQEGTILRFVFWHSLALAILMGLLVMLQAYWLKGMIP
jgi:lactate permease